MSVEQTVPPNSDENFFTLPTLTNDLHGCVSDISISVIRGSDTNGSFSNIGIEL